MSNRRGLLFVLSSPSGAGKTTLSRKLLEAESKTQQLAMSVSVTTRPMRPGEVHGKDYFFHTQPEFESMVAGGQLLEYAQVFDYGYGTPRAFVEKQLQSGIDVLFDIDWQGTRQLAAQMREDLVSVFILPPSLSELERRLKARAQDDEAVVKKRMAKAQDEISHWQEYDYVLVNDDLDATLSKITAILIAERLKRIRQMDLDAFIKNL